MWKEFKEFAFRGNVMDMAIGVIIGSAFSGIVNALVNMLTSVISIATNGIQFAEMSLSLAGTAIVYGEFIQAVLNFFIIAACVFAMVKAMNRLHHKKETPAPDVPSAPSAEMLLAEIRDLLKEQAASGPSAAAPEKEV